jgi:hypothetical protein
MAALNVELRDGSVKPFGEPPISVTEEFHRRGDHDDAHNGGVYEDRCCEPNAHHFDGAVAECETEKHATYSVCLVVFGVCAFS